MLPHRFKAGTSDAYFSYLLCGPQYWFLPDLPGSGLNLTNGRCAAGFLLCPPQNGQWSDSGVGDRGQIENKGTERQKMTKVIEIVSKDLKSMIVQRVCQLNKTGRKRKP